MNEQLAIDGGSPVRTKPFGPTHDFGEEDVEAVAEVIRSGHLAKGPAVKQFEADFAARHGVKYAVTVNSGTSAMHTCIAAINPDPGDEVIVTPWTSGGSIIGVLLHNCVPIFADIDDTYNVDPSDVEKRITPRTRAIMAVHIHGNPSNMGALGEIAKRHGLFLIEDFCQAHFAESQGEVVGSIGDINGASFGGKHLSAGGGGVVLTNNEVLWERALIFSDAALPRTPGPYAGRPYENYFMAPNYKITDVMAAILSVQLKKVDGYIENKVRAAKNIIEGISDVDELVPQQVRSGDRHTYWNFALTIDTDRLNCTQKDFANSVTAEGLGMLGRPHGSAKGALYRNPTFTGPNTYGKSRFPFDYGRENPVDYHHVKLPYGEELMGRTVSFSMLPSFSEEDVGDIIHALRKVAIHYRN